VRGLAAFALACPAVLPALAAPASADIRAGEAFVLLAEGPGRGLQATPAVAFGAGAYLAVWREGWHGKGGSARITATRVSDSGTVLDGRGIEIAPSTAGVQERPRVAFGGGLFLVVWQDLRHGKDYDILAARAGPDGRVLDREPIAIAAGPRNQVFPDVASDGRGFLVVWQSLEGTETGYRGFAAPVAADGRVGPRVETGMTPQPKVAWDGPQYLAAAGGSGAWAGSVQAVRLDAGGAPQGKPVQVIRGTKAAVFSLAPSPGRGWLVVSPRSPPDPWGWGGPGAMRAVRIDRDGQPENTDGLREPSGVRDRLPGWLDMGLEKTAGATWPWGESAIAHDGRHHVVVWQRYHLGGEKRTEFENGDLIAARVDGFRSLDPAGIPVADGPTDETSPALAGGGDGRLLLLYERHETDGRATVVGRLLTTR
jgi:hypothetical protein